MAASLKQDSPVSPVAPPIDQRFKPDLVNKIEVGNNSEINGVVKMPGKDAIITVSSDRYTPLRHWLLYSLLTLPVSLTDLSACGCLGTLASTGQVCATTWAVQRQPFISTKSPGGSLSVSTPGLLSNLRSVRLASQYNYVKRKSLSECRICSCQKIATGWTMSKITTLTHKGSRASTTRRPKSGS